MIRLQTQSTTFGVMSRYDVFMENFKFISMVTKVVEMMLDGGSRMTFPMGATKYFLILEKFP